MIPDDGFQLTDDHYRDDRLRLLAALAALPIDRVALVVAPDVPTMAMLRTVTRANLDQAHRIVWTTVEAAARSVFRGSDPGDVFIDPACAAAANMLPPRLARQYDEALAVLTALGSLGWPRSCPNCDHPAHDGLACTCTTDDSPPAPCACSWPTPDNFTTPTYWLPPGVLEAAQRTWIGADVDDAGALTVVAAQVQPDGPAPHRHSRLSSLRRRLRDLPRRRQRRRPHRAGGRRPRAADRPGEAMNRPDPPDPARLTERPMPPVALPASGQVLLPATGPSDHHKCQTPGGTSPHVQVDGTMYRWPADPELIGTLWLCVCGQHWYCRDGGRFGDWRPISRRKARKMMERDYL